MHVSECRIPDPQIAESIVVVPSPEDAGLATSPEPTEMAVSVESPEFGQPWLPRGAPASLHGAGAELLSGSARWLAATPMSAAETDHFMSVTWSASRRSLLHHVTTVSRVRDEAPWATRRFHAAGAPSANVGVRGRDFDVLASPAATLQWIMREDGVDSGSLDPERRATALAVLDRLEADLQSNFAELSSLALAAASSHELPGVIGYHADDGRLMIVEAAAAPELAELVGRLGEIRRDLGTSMDELLR